MKCKICNDTGIVVLYNDTSNEIENGKIETTKQICECRMNRDATMEKEYNVLQDVFDIYLDIEDCESILVQREKIIITMNKRLTNYFTDWDLRTSTDRFGNEYVDFMSCSIGRINVEVIA